MTESAAPAGMSLEAAQRDELYRRASSAAQVGELLDCIKLCTRALGGVLDGRTLPPSEHRFGNLLALCLIRLGRHEPAMRLLDSIQPTDADRAEHAAMVMAARFARQTFGDALRDAVSLPDAWCYDIRTAGAVIEIYAACGEIDAYFERIDFGRLLREAPEYGSKAMFWLPYAASAKPARLRDSLVMFFDEERRRLNLPDPTRPPPAPERKADDPRIHLGYLCRFLGTAGFQATVLPLLARHDLSRFRVTILLVDGSAEGGFDAPAGVAVARLAGDAPAEIASRIAEQGIDVLIDLVGLADDDDVLYRALFWKPAPIIVNWLNATGTSGHPAIDYMVADPILVPPGSDGDFTEAVARRRSVSVCYWPSRPLPSPAPLPAEGRIRFGNSSNHHKITPQSIALWARVLSAVPDSDFALRSPLLRDETLCERARRLFGRYGIARERVITEPTAGFAGYLRSYDDVSIILGTTPANGGLTIMEALWMGVPTVCLTGAGYMSRIGLDVMTPFGMQDLCPGSEEEFVAVAAALARDRRRLAALRSGLRSEIEAGRGFDAARLTRETEELLVEMVEARREGRPARFGPR